MNLANHHPTDLWGRDARNAARTENNARREQQALANALLNQQKEAERKRLARKLAATEGVVRCPSCEEPGFVGAVCGCGWQL